MLRAFFETESKKQDGWTKVAMAETLGMHHQSVYFWSTGDRRPENDDLREAIARITRIPPSAWVTDAEAKRKKKFRSAA